jgi:hypothetical protein
VFKRRNGRKDKGMKGINGRKKNAMKKRMRSPVAFKSTFSTGKDTKFNLKPAMKAQKGSKGTCLLFL